MLVRHIVVKVFQPGNKHFRTLRLQAPPRKGFTEQGIEAALKQIADQIERFHPNEEYELKELTGRQFNFVWKGAKEPACKTPNTREL